MANGIFDSDLSVFVPSVKKTCTALAIERLSGIKIIFRSSCGSSTQIILCAQSVDPRIVGNASS